MHSDLLIHTVEVRRRSGRVDRFGQPIDHNPSRTSEGDYVGSYSGRVYTKSGGLTNEERSRDVFEDLRYLHLEPEADVREDDTVRVSDSDGREVVPWAKVKQKRFIYDRLTLHHLELVLQIQRGPQ
jgi:hypothetical protein